jgi:hypothetical protein
MLGLPSTPPVKPHTRRTNKYISARATYPTLTFNTARKATYPQGKQIARATYHRLTFHNTARNATYSQGKKNTQVLEPHTLDLPLTPPVKPHTRRENNTQVLETRTLGLPCIASTHILPLS